MTVWFDVEDLVHYFRSGNKRISGIQRLSFEIFQAAKALEGEGVAIRFVRHGAMPPALLTVSWNDLLAEFGPGAPEPSRPRLPSVPEPDAPPPPVLDRPHALPRRWARRAADVLPPEVRRPLVLAAVMQLQVGRALAAFGLGLAGLPVRRAIGGSRRLAAGYAARRATKRKLPGPFTRVPGPESFEALAAPGDTLLVLGAPWNRERYSDLARHLRDERRMRFGVLVHDLVPIRHPEWCHRGTPRMFREWYADVLPACDLVLANSRHTARDVETYARESGIVLNGRVRALPIGSGFGDGGVPAVMPGLPAPMSGLPAAMSGLPAAMSGLPAAGSYVLFVSTMEARKNHALLFRVWSKLLDAVADGERAPETVPDLVFAGRIGWLVADLLAQLDHTAWLGRRVRFVPDPTDAELRALYAGCLFTVFPSLHEGWGLPVTESLALGKPCLSSSAASLPEAGGPLCRYFDPESVASAYAAVTAVLDDRPGLAAWEAQVRREFRPRPWTDTARALLDAVDALEPEASLPGSG